MSFRLNNFVLNQKGNPAWYEDTIGNLPAANLAGRMFVSIDSFAFYRDNGTGWDLIGGPGTGTITGSGTTGTITKFVGAQVLGDSIISEIGSAITVNGSLTATTIIKSGGTSAQFLKADGTIDSNVYLPLSGGTMTGTINMNNAGSVNNATSLISSTITSGEINVVATPGTGFLTAVKIIKNGGSSSEFLKADGSIDSSVYLTSSGAVTSLSAGTGISLNASVGAVTITNTITNNNQLTNGAGYITSSALTPYLPLAAGSGSPITGQLFINNASQAILNLKYTGSGALQASVSTFSNRFLIYDETNGGAIFNSDQSTGLVTIYSNRVAAVTINSSQIVNTVSRLNVNGATDNSLFALNVSGCTYTNTLSPTASTKTTSFTIGDNHTYIFTGAAGQTATLENPASTNKIFYIKNFSGNTLTIASYAGGATLIDNTNTAQTSISLLTGKTICIQQSGSTQSFILSIY